MENKWKKLVLLLTFFEMTSAYHGDEELQEGLLDFGGGRGAARNVLQRIGERRRGRFACALDRGEIRSILNETTRVWRIDDAALSDVENDLQAVVNCSEEGDIILLDVDDIVQFPNRVIIPWRLTLSGSVPETRLEDRIFPETRRKQRVGCPRDDEGVFLVRARDALFANFVFEDCSLGSAEASTAIVGVEACRAENVTGSVQLHHVVFVGNRLEGSVALNMSHVSCSALELVDVEFENNTCSGFCGVVMSAENELRNVRIISTTRVGSIPVIPAILYAPPQSSTAAEGIVANGNEGAVLYVDHGALELSDSSFIRNEVEVDGDIIPYGSGMHLDGATATVRRCRFEENRALQGAAIHALQSNLTLRNSVFSRNEAEERGGAVYLLRCEAVDITNCSFAENSLQLLEGAGIFANATASLTLKRNRFNGNKAGTGGAVYVVGGPLEVRDCRFENNSASVNAGGLYFEGTVVESRHLFFLNNTATIHGGAFHVHQSEEAMISNLTCSENSAQDGGCLRVRDTPFSLISSAFRRNVASYQGGGLSANTTTASIVGCIFEANSGSYGGGLNLMVSDTAELRQVNIVSNYATHHAGGAVLMFGRFVIANSTFEANSCEQYAGGFTCAENAIVTVDRTMFSRNVAQISGAGSNVVGNCTALFTNSTWTSNRAVGPTGGGATVDEGRSSFVDSIFEQNVADMGSAVMVVSSVVNFSGVILRSNRAAVRGAIAGHNATVTILNCNAEGNEAFDGAAVFFMAASRANIHHFSAVSNVASNSGGVMAFEESVAYVSDSAFEHNSATSTGGTIVLARANATLLNVTVLDSSSDSAGGLAVTANSTVTVRNSNFGQSRATSFGGAVYVSDSQIALSNTTMALSRSESLGGGLCLLSSIVYINVSNISDNFAQQDGGGIYTWNSVVVAENLAVERNAVGSQGGGVYFTNGSTFRLTNSTFVQNQGMYGGALAVDSGSAGQLSDTSALNNSASTSGGFAYVTSANLSISDGQFVENEASFGGHVVLTNSGRLDVQGAEFRNGSATQGGGCLYASESIVVVRDSALSGSGAAAGGAIVLSDSYLWGRNLRITDCRADTDGGAIVANHSSSILCSGCVFAENSAGRRGGGVYLESPKTQLLAFQFDGCTFENNSADRGGGLHFVNEDRLVNCAEPNANCTFVALRGSRFVGNEALSAGGAILSSDLNSIRMSCSYEPRSDPQVYLTRAQFEVLSVLSSLHDVCPSWERNDAQRYGDHLASYARRVRRVIRFQGSQEEQEVEGNVYFLRSHLSGMPIPSLGLTVVDELGQGPAVGSRDETVEATMWSPDRFFAGSIRIRLENGVGNFSGIVGYREPGFYDVRVNYSERGIPSFTIVVETRRCTVGESAASNGTICEPCNADSFNFFPDEVDSGCTACPEEAKCDTSVIRPLDGFWHSSPCSVNIQECLTERACDEESRDERLKAIGLAVRSCNFSDQFIRNYTSAECKKGYRGPLCGSCESEFGRSLSFRCEPCIRRFGSFALVLLSVVFLLFLSYVAIRSSLPSQTKSKQSSVSQTRGAGTSVAPRGNPSASSPPANLEMVEVLHTARAPKGVARGRKKQRRRSSPPRQQHVVELAKWKAVEIFKITVNYLQVIAVAIAVNVNWTESLLTVFEIAEFIGGVTSEATTRSVDCLVSSDSTIPKTAVRTVVNVMVPMLVTAMYFTFWALTLVVSQETTEYLFKRCILSFMAVSYLSYISLTRTAVNVLACVKVYDSVKLGDDSTTRYWSADTSMECYEGSHTVLAALIGWPVLILFSIGFPVAVASAFLFERNKHGLKREWLFESMGFMYRAYSEQYVFWESMIMLRKAILAIVVAFSYSLGGNLQGLLCVCVLVVALYFQLVCAPFRPEFENLDNYEGLSLFVSTLTFVSGLFFNDDRTSQLVRFLLSVLLALANIGLLLFLLAMFWKTSADYLRVLMDAEGMDYDPDKGAFYIVRLYISTRLRQYYTKIATRIQARRATPPLSSNV